MHAVCITYINRHFILIFFLPKFYFIFLLLSVSSLVLQLTHLMSHDKVTRGEGKLTAVPWFLEPGHLISGIIIILLLACSLLKGGDGGCR